MSENLIDYWRAVLPLTVGIALSTNDRQLLRQQLYKVRLASKDMSLEGISIVFPEEPADELWLVKKDYAENSR